VFVSVNFRFGIGDTVGAVEVDDDDGAVAVVVAAAAFLVFENVVDTMFEYSSNRCG
jgi:hypothetical protein